ncbi:serine/threonine-protein phosphatase 6 regulatory ankyrin repeat subunit B-like [Copidosoma floridanum]|uniref:serine/threonine-protein phosphatase 6 regulatory ankyrin repeat subunit B-like n=1 Tax=Copidosoma floridanum TaxID=29053 RepID=UPI000C6FC76F|nr:serine/threonine-protein phosphatase 6 regulatory ankyrin repeat subunit B-like [Copidosoma floridanum]
MDSLHKAVRDRDHDRLEELLRSGMCDINQKNDKGETPLEIAVFLGDFCATKLLLDFGAEPILQADSLTQDTGIRGGKTVVIRELINRGCHPDRITYPPHRVTDTIWNMVIEMNDPELLQCLLQSAEREIHDDDWSNALLFTACVKGSYRIVEYLISCKLPLDNKDAEGRSALFYAVLGGDIRTFKLLMDNGANLHQLDKNGANLMHYAVESINHHDFVQLLLENNVNVNVCSKYNGMPLHHAIYRNWLFTINSLVENNANISRGDLYGRNPFVAAIDIDWGIADYSCFYTGGKQ